MKRLWDALMRLENHMLFDSEGRPHGRRFPATRTGLTVAILCLSTGLVLISGRVLWWTEPTTGPGALLILAALISLFRRTLARRRAHRPTEPA